ncbi:Very-short-patch-repair endonuclease [Algoriphagus ornithinivorans]|uniref:Very-short-patch-repair endonuclease n=1 Tax=Algoriphagus ornithinivorans TaxID=226506 RepID=A0A1I5EY94_9BACT|nr:endonuclease domain-containing protein [Algoriphagus ornithinivorans]SFO16437.1 Very-short-patch-repair endonuclease [Algoriphagus ornithinivorans]
MRFIPYSKSLKEFSRELRSHSTLSEVLLWKQLRASRFRGYSFNRQKPLSKFIVDFYCKKLNLVIEIDGESHFDEGSVISDKQRQEVLESFGLNFLRFLDIEIKRSMPSVLEEINAYIDDWEDKNGWERTSF